VTATRELGSAPGTLGLYAKAAAPLVPGAALLPFVAGRGEQVPDVELALGDATVEPERVAPYARVCGFTLRDTAPLTYPHILAFPLHLALMTDGAFPFPAVGLIHIENRIVQHRPIRLGERLELRVRPTQVEPHPRGRAFSIETGARAGGELVWEERSTELRRGGGSKEAKGEAEEKPGEELPASAEWRLPGDLGRRYAAVSGDRNPIHLYGLSARLFGFKRAIAHGMWTKARCLAALEPRLSEAFAVHVRFRRPIFLPATVAFAHDEALRFAVRDARDGTPHLDGAVGEP
jgi:acyl dehydratase